MDADIGVPNSAEKQDAIPHIIAIFISALSENEVCPSFNFLPIKFPRLPPICKAAPSLPALPQPKCVKKEEIYIAGAIFSGMVSPEDMESITQFVPLGLSAFIK